MLQPTQEKVAVHRTAKGKRPNDVICTLGRNNARPGKMSAADDSNDWFPARGITILPTIVFVKAAFITVMQLCIIGQCFYFGNELFSLLLIPFSILDCVFLRVIPNTFFALRIPETLQLKAISVSLFVLYGFF